MNNLINIEQSLLKLMKEEPQELEKILPALAAIPAAIAAGAARLGAGALAAGAAKLGAGALAAGAAGGKIAAVAGKAAAGAGRGAVMAGGRAAARSAISGTKDSLSDSPPEYDPETEAIMPIAASIKKLMKAQPWGSQQRTNTMRGQQFGGGSPMKWGIGSGGRTPTMGGGGSSSPFGTAANLSDNALASSSDASRVAEAKGTAAAEGYAERLGTKVSRAGDRALHGPPPEPEPMKVTIVDPNEEKSIENALTPSYADDSASTESSALEKSLLKLMKADEPAKRNNQKRKKFETWRKKQELENFGGRLQDEVRRRAAAEIHHSDWESPRTDVLLPLEHPRSKLFVKRKNSDTEDRTHNYAAYRYLNQIRNGQTMGAIHHQKGIKAVGQASHFQQGGRFQDEGGNETPHVFQGANFHQHPDWGDPSARSYLIKNPMDIHTFLDDHTEDMVAHLSEEKMDGAHDILNKIRQEAPPTLGSKENPYPPIENALLKLMKAQLDPNRFNKPSGFNTSQNNPRTASEIADFTPGAGSTTEPVSTQGLRDTTGKLVRGLLGGGFRDEKPKQTPIEITIANPDTGTADAGPKSTGWEMPDTPSGAESTSTDSAPSNTTTKVPEVKEPKSLLNTLEKLMKADSSEDTIDHEGLYDEYDDDRRKEFHRLIEEAGAKNAAKKKALREQRAQYLATDLGDADLDSETQRLMSKPITPPEPPIYSGRVLGLDEFSETDPHGDESFSSSSTEYKPSRKPTKRDLDFSIENSLLKLMK